jgi:hypothetical protein
MLFLFQVSTAIFSLKRDPFESTYDDFMEMWLQVCTKPRQLGFIGVKYGIPIRRAPSLPSNIRLGSDVIG